MKLLKKIIAEINSDDNPYSINIGLLLEDLLDYEIDIPDDIYEKRHQKGLIGSAIHYLDDMPDMETIECDNSYNWNGRISHDFFYMMATASGGFYIAVQINLGYDDPR